MNESSQKITYEYLWKSIIRPPRDYYKDEDLGPLTFELNGRLYIRKDFEIIDFHGKLLKVSFIEPDIKDRPFEIMPCVIYIHANSSSRIEGINNKRYLLKNNINVCAFDFEGSGYSEGEYISLGYHEKYQVKNIVDFVEKYPGVGEIGLWGRSMGAATTLIYASMDTRIKAIVVDSPFSDFRRVAKEMCLAQVSVPNFLLEGAISIIGKSVYKKNGMKINEIRAIDAVKNCYIPVIFIHARDDDIVKFQHSLDLYNNYAGKNKKLKDVSGGHNGRRPLSLLELIGKFFSKYLQNEDDEEYNNYIKNKKDDDENLNSSSSEKDNSHIDNYNFNLNQRKKKTIYEEMGMGKNKLDNTKFNSNIIIDNNINETKNINIENINKKEDNKVECKQILNNKNQSNFNEKEEKKEEILIKAKTEKLTQINNLNKDSDLNIINEKNNCDLNINNKEKTDLSPPKIRKTIYDDLRIRK